MTDLILDYLDRGPRVGRTKLAPRICERVSCRVVFRPTTDHPRKKYCSKSCAGRSRRRRFRNPKLIPCACGAKYRQTNGNKTCCARCAEQRRKENRAERLTRNRATRGMMAPLGPPTCETCGPMQALAFGSDRNGRSTTYCPHCGEAPLVIYGRVTHDQRPRLEAELAGNVERAQREVDPETSARSSRGRKIPMQTNTEAA